MKHFRLFLVVFSGLSATLSSHLAAQELDVPFDTCCPPDAQAACFGAATVMGLDPNGDGFLAVRTGPVRITARLARSTTGTASAPTA